MSGSVLRRFLLLLLLISFGFAGGNKKSAAPFAPLDKGTERYYIAGMYSESDHSSLYDSIGEFYTDDPAILKEFAREWVFTEPAPHYACGYHYHIALCKEGRKVTDCLVNLNCETIVIGDKSLKFSKEKLRRFKGRLQKAKKQDKSYENLDAARRALSTISLDKNTLYIRDSDWEVHEGYFRFDYAYRKRNPDRILRKLRQEISSAYPGESFELEESGGSLGVMYVKVNCNKSLFDRFSLYQVKEKEWKTFSLYLTWWARPGNKP